MSTFYVLPGVYPKELDLTGQTSPISTSIGALVFGSRQGTMDTYFETNLVDFETIYGQSDFTWTFGHAIVRAFLTVGKAIYLQRVVNNALHAGSIVANNVSGIEANSTEYFPFSSGSALNYLNGSREYQTLVFGGPLITGNSVSIVMKSDYNAVVHTFTQAFTTDSDTTLAALAAQINLQLTTDPWIVDGYAVGSAEVVDDDEYPALGTSNNRVIRILSPQNTHLTIQSMSVSGGASHTTITNNANTKLFEVWCENPGQHGNNVGYKILNVDQGVAQRIQLSFAAPMTTSTQFSMIIKLNNVQVPFAPVPFDTDQETTLSDIADAIYTALGSHSETIVDPDGNGLEINVVSPVDGPNTLQFINPTVTGAVGPATNPTVTATQVLTGIASSQTFDLWVYTRDDVNSPKERFTVSFLQQSDGNGVPLFIENKINTSAARSDYIRVAYNSYNGAAQLNDVPVNGTAIQWLSGGDDGLLPTNAQIAAAWQQNFASRRKVPCRILINGGYSSPVVQQIMDSICQTRFDCFSILDMPQEYQRATDAINYRNNVLDINSSYSALYTPNVQITDTDTGQTLYIPPSGHVAAQFAYNDSVAAEWYAPAGLNRGLLRNVTGLEQDYDDAEMTLLVSAQINPLVKESGAGYQIKSANTLQVKASALSNINVRRLLITIEVSLVDALNYSIYEPNTSFTRMLIVQLTTNFLQPIKDNFGLYDFAVVCDDRNNQDYLVDEGQADVDIYLKPVLPIKFIQLTSVITKTGAYFQEIIAAVSGSTPGTT